jgi:hypothetical protein
VTSLDTAYFDFDNYNLKPETREVLKKDANWLSKNPDKKVVIEGNCAPEVFPNRKVEACKWLRPSLGTGPYRWGERSVASLPRFKQILTGKI